MRGKEEEGRGGEVKKCDWDEEEEGGGGEEGALRGGRRKSGSKRDGYYDWRV